MKVGDTVSVTKDIVLTENDVISAGTWGDIIEGTIVSSSHPDLFRVKFHVYRTPLYIDENYLQKEEEDQSAMMAEYAAQGGFEPDDALCQDEGCPQSHIEHICNNKPDMINHPPHYQSDTGIECIDAIRAMLGKEGFIAFLRGTILAYEWRLGRKDEPAQELGKIGWYQKRLQKALLDD